MHHEDIYSRLRRASFDRPPLVGDDDLKEDVFDDELSDDDDASESFFAPLGAEEVVAVAEIMSRNVFCATPDMRLDTIACIMLDQCISGAPVVDEAGRPIGVISKTDVLRELRELSELEKATWRDRDRPDGTVAAGFKTETEGSYAGLHLHSLSARTAVDAMTPVVFWLHEDACISQAAALMAYERVHRIPIVNKAGRIVGVVSTLDILRWLATRRGYLIPR